MKNYNKILTVIFLLYIFTILYSQDSSDVFINVGLITNIEKCSECEKRDTGGSIRLGILTQGKLGFYCGYVWFKEYHTELIEYDDEGKFYFGGIDYQILRKEDFRCFINIGLGVEHFISTYPNRTEEESSIKPDLGLLINLKHFNAYTGWQPSEPSHFNLGLGITI